MKLWHLYPKKDKNGMAGAPWHRIHDMAYGFVVRASSAPAARRLAAEKAGDEGPNAWLDKEWSACEELKAEGEAGVILRDFHAG